MPADSFSVRLKKKAPADGLQYRGSNDKDAHIEHWSDVCEQFPVLILLIGMSAQDVVFHRILACENHSLAICISKRKMVCRI